MAKSDGWLKVKGLDCPSEESRIREALANWPGLDRLEFDLSGGRVRAAFDSARTDLDSIAQAIESRCGYGCSRIEATAAVSRLSDTEPGIWSWLGLRGRSILAAGFFAVCGVSAWALGAEKFELATYALSILCSGFWILPKAWDGFRRGRLDIFVLVALAIVGAAFLGQWDEAATVGVLFGVSELLETYAVRKAKVSIQALIDLTPERAERIEADGEIRVVDPAELVAGDRVRVRPGQKLPVDGRVIAGIGNVDQQIITGESMPVTVEPGSEVFAGTVNGEAVLILEANRRWGECVIQKIAERVREAHVRRAPIERIVDRFARFYTPAVVVIATFVAFGPTVWSWANDQPTDWRTWLFRGLVLLVIACPCALVISTPVAIVSALANAARHGILVRDGGVIERFGQLIVIAFDKTGTLTVGRPDVIAAEGLPDASEVDSMLVKAAAVGRDGSHLVSRAIVRHAHSRSLSIPEASHVRETPGLGTAGTVDNERIHLGSHRYLDQEGLCDERFHDRLTEIESRVGTSVAVANEQGPVGWIRLADQARPEAAEAIGRLRVQGVRTIMLTGDNAATAMEMARNLGIDDVRAGLMPEEKAGIIEEAVRRNGLVGMVGDGVNDAPALAVASVGVCMGTVAGAVTSQAADVVLVNDNLESIPRLVALSRRTVKTIRFNVAFALVTKVIVVVLAVMGLAGFWMAMAADVGVSLLVVAHALRLLRFDAT
jgi:Cd2+/Zn2+-exporting ATPase